MKFALLIAKRFMLGGKGSGASRFTGWIAVIGLAVGCFALIISVAVLNGFEARVTEKVMGFEGDLRLSGAPPSGTLEELADSLVIAGLVTAYMPFFERKGLIINDFDDSRMVTIKAVDFSTILDFYDLGLDSLISEQSVLVGSLLAQRLNLVPGDNLKLMSPVDAPLGFGLPRLIRLPVAGVFRAEVLDYDDRMIFIPLPAGRKLFTRKKTIDGIDLRLINTEKQAHTRQQIASVLPANIRVKSWAELHQGLFSAMRMERIGAIIVLSMIILVASFNLASTLALITYQKIREIGILRAMGVTRDGIRNILLTQGLIIGGLGASTGLGLSLLVVLIQQQTGIIPLPAEIYIIEAVPMELYWHDLVLIPVIAFILIIFASLIAGKRAILIQPKDAVQMEK